MPPMPRMERISKTRNGLRPPVVSTQAEKGMRSSEPESMGMATSKPTNTGLSCMTSLNLCAVGPYNDTAAKPMKNPNVAPKRPSVGFPLSLYLDMNASYQFGFRVNTLRLSRAAIPHNHLIRSPEIRDRERHQVYEPGKGEEGNHEHPH